MIEDLFTNARRIKTSRFLVSYGVIPNLENPCISMVAPKKVAKTAVLRNRLRRKGYAVVAPLLPNIKPHMAILVTYADGNPDFVNADATGELDEAFKKAGLYI